MKEHSGHPKQQKHFLDKLPLIALRLKTVPFHAIAAFGYDQFRKPSPGMWDAFTRRFNDGIPIGPPFRGVLSFPAVLHADVLEVCRLREELLRRRCRWSSCDCRERSRPFRLRSK